MSAESLLGHYFRTLALATARPHEAQQPDELPEALRASIDHMFDLIHGKVDPVTGADWDILEEHDQKLRDVMQLGGITVDVRQRPERTSAEPKLSAGVRVVPEELRQLMDLIEHPGTEESLVEELGRGGEIARSQQQTSTGLQRGASILSNVPDVAAEQPKQRRPGNVREAVAQLRVGAQPPNSVDTQGEVPNW